MPFQEKAIIWEWLSFDPSARYAKTSGVADLATVIQDETFSIFELMKLIDTTRDPKIYPQDAVLVFNTVKAVLAKFSRFGQPTKMADQEP